ncbi:DUF2911 domain-containing protein [Luteitalea sp. TBR-22]|uniref:DUF2911 domain-containing protein n=1 Tax=Luteitalea sp. TBR-22 TaxID=2802971 RepID=UPI001EF4D7CC|nr:DUF2911 domain-containing protein [Luteitalea sp. TBR-22]
MLTRLTMTAASLVLAATASAQSVPEVKLPPSPMGQAAVQLGGSWSKTADGERYQGGKWIVVDYSRPLLRGRKNIFGSGAEYGKAVMAGAPLWRAGANATTTLTTQLPLMVGDKRLEPGVYNVFVDLKPGNWTLVISNQPRQPKYDPKDKVNLYGTYNYDPKFDVVRVPMLVDSVEYSVEQFMITFINATDTSVVMAMAWENTAALAELTVAK